MDSLLKFWISREVRRAGPDLTSNERLLARLLKFSTKEKFDGTMNFSVPEEVKKQFDKVFAGKNKSAVLTQFMQQAIEERKREERRKRAIDHLLTMRQQAPQVTNKAIRLARTQGRP